jgi:predicted nuclease with TOPRIM domain
MTQKELKIPLSCRVQPDMKEDLEAEAYDAGLTTSMYMEQILQSRHVSAEPGEEMEYVAEDLEELQEYAENLEEQIHDLGTEKAALEEKLNQASDESARLKELADGLEREVQPFRSLGISNLRPENLAEIEGYFAALEGKYPEVSRVQLLMAALDRTLKNEKSTLFIHTLQGYFGSRAAQNKS